MQLQSILTNWGAFPFMWHRTGCGAECNARTNAFIRHHDDCSLVKTFYLVCIGSLAHRPMYTRVTQAVCTLNHSHQALRHILSCHLVSFGTTDNFCFLSKQSRLQFASWPPAPDACGSQANVNAPTIGFIAPLIY